VEDAGRPDEKVRKKIEEESTSTVGSEVCPEKYYVWIECANEQEQPALLERFQAEGLNCCCKII